MNITSWTLPHHTFSFLLLIRQYFHLICLSHHQSPPVSRLFHFVITTESCWPVSTAQYPFLLGYSESCIRWRRFLGDTISSASAGKSRIFNDCMSKVRILLHRCVGSGNWWLKIDLWSAEMNLMKETWTLSLSDNLLSSTRDFSYWMFGMKKREMRTHVLILLQGRRERTGRRVKNEPHFADVFMYRPQRTMSMYDLMIGW